MVVGGLENLGLKGWKPFTPIIEQNEEMKTDQGSMENLCPGKASDEPDRALQTSPQPPEGPGLPKRSPLIRNRKAGSMEVMGGPWEEEGVETQFHVPSEAGGGPETVSGPPYVWFIDCLTAVPSLFKLVASDSNQLQVRGS